MYSGFDTPGDLVRTNSFAKAVLRSPCIRLFWPGLSLCQSRVIGGHQETPRFNLKHGVVDHRPPYWPRNTKWVSQQEKGVTTQTTLPSPLSCEQPTWVMASSIWTAVGTLLVAFILKRAFDTWRILRSVRYVSQQLLLGDLLIVPRVTACRVEYRSLGP